MGISSRRPRRPNRSVCSCCGLRVWKIRWKHDILSKKKKKPEKKSENAQWRRLFLFQLLLIYLVFLFLPFFLNSLFCLSLWHFPIALTYERTVPTKTVWQRKEKFADTYGRVNCFFRQSLISLLFFFVVVVCLFLLSALICLTVLFSLTFSDTSKLLRTVPTKTLLPSKEKIAERVDGQNSIWTPDRCRSGN